MLLLLLYNKITYIHLFLLNVNKIYIKCISIYLFI